MSFNTIASLVGLSLIGIAILIGIMSKVSKRTLEKCAQNNAIVKLVKGLLYAALGISILSIIRACMTTGMDY